MEHYKTFKRFYDELMIKNDAPIFFYNDEYYEQLGNLGHEKLRLFGIFQNNELVGGVIVIIYKNYALYHLGALKKGLNNLEVLTFISSNYGKFFMKRVLKYLILVEEELQILTIHY